MHALLRGMQVSATLLGEPDLGLLTPPEMARKAGSICYNTPGMAVLVDADTGAARRMHLLVVHRCVAWLRALHGCMRSVCTVGREPGGRR